MSFSITSASAELKWQKEQRVGAKLFYEWIDGDVALFMTSVLLIHRVKT